MTAKAPPKRRSIRLPRFDYGGTGAFFVTICTQNRQPLFGDIHDAIVQLNAIGRIVLEAWVDLPNHHPRVALDAFVVMPNHVHGVLLIGDDRAAGAAGRAPTTLPRRFGPPEPAALSTIIRSYKSSTTRRINLARGTLGSPLWQRNYFEHVVRNDEDLAAIRKYIVDNPMQWALDEYNPGQSVHGKDIRRT